jgi:sulfur carrier protein ThiS
MKTALKTLVAATTVAVALALVAVLVGLPSFGNPFMSETEIRDHAAVLQSLEEIAELRAATGEYQVIIDIEESTRFVPGFLKGQRTTFLAQGTVDALVDLGELDDESVIVAEDGSVTVLLPPARLADPVVDHDASSVLDRDRGVMDRVGGVFSDAPTSDKGLYLEAERRLAEAAADSDLLATGEANAAATVEELLREAGIERVRVLFASPDAVA